MTAKAGKISGSGSGSHWASVLTQYAKSAKPKSTLPRGVYLRSDDQTLAIYDCFPKARFHFLVLPRIPFPLPPLKSMAAAGDVPSAQPLSVSVQPSANLALAGGKLALGASKSSSNTVPASHLRSLNDLLASPYAQQILDAMQRQSQSVVALIKEEMRRTSLSLPQSPSQPQHTSDRAQTTFNHSRTSGGSDCGECGVEWGINVGFHAVPSMDTVHLHIISDDLVSLKLKHKKHYNSFHPTLGFWLDFEYVYSLVQQGKKALPHSPAYYDKLLKAPLISFRDGKMYTTMPALKHHLEQSWIEKLRQSLGENGLGLESNNDDRISLKRAASNEMPDNNDDRVITTKEAKRHTNA